MKLNFSSPTDLGLFIHETANDICKPKKVCYGCPFFNDSGNCGIVALVKLIENRGKEDNEN